MLGWFGNWELVCNIVMFGLWLIVFVCIFWIMYKLFVILVVCGSSLFIYVLELFCCLNLKGELISGRFDWFLFIVVSCWFWWILLGSFLLCWLFNMGLWLNRLICEGLFDWNR